MRIGDHVAHQPCGLAGVDEIVDDQQSLAGAAARRYRDGVVFRWRGSEVALVWHHAAGVADPTGDIRGLGRLVKEVIAAVQD